MIACIGSDEAGVGDERGIGLSGLDSFDHRDQQLLFAAGTVYRRFNDDLVLGINGCLLQDIE